MLDLFFFYADILNCSGGLENEVFKQRLHILNKVREVHTKNAADLGYYVRVAECA